MLWEFFFTNLDKWLEINNYFTPGEKRVDILADKYSLRNCLFFTTFHGQMKI